MLIGFMKAEQRGRNREGEGEKRERGTISCTKYRQDLSSKESMKNKGLKDMSFEDSQQKSIREREREEMAPATESLS